MKEILIALFAIVAVSSAAVIINAEGQDTPHLLGAKVCTWGPSYWCQNLTTAAGCRATKHCVQKEWIHMKVPEDTDSVCGICKDMVTQARDQLESNQTQQDLKDVFEGSCKLIHIKPIVHECIKLADEFVPDLVETLASQMDPSVVCTVAGLCNSAHIDKLLEEYKGQESQMKVEKTAFGDDELDPNDCSKCYTIATHMVDKFQKTSRDNFLQQLLRVCGQFSSFSDACSSIVLTHFETIYDHLQNNFKADNICHLSGQCSSKFHKHDDEKNLEVEIRPLSSVGMVEIGDDLPCKLCEQLVGHLKELLVANTTESEFKMVLDGLCKQTKSFAPECISIVDQYYPEIYSFLTKQLNGNAVCEMAGICPEPGKSVYNGPIAPLLPEAPRKIAERFMENAHHSEAEEMQLPIERHLPFSSLAFPQMDLQGKKTCAFCEMLLHYVQQVVTTPKTEEEVKQVFDKVCTKLPSSIKDTCDEFVNTYGDAIVAILVQEIDPSTVCPLIHVCPTEEQMDFWEKIPSEMILKSEVKDKPSCPLCLLAVTQIYNTIKDNKTEANIEYQLSRLCSHLPKSLVEECSDLVKGYSRELIEMLLADFSPQEVCTSIKLCDPTEHVGSTIEAVNSFPLDKDGEIMTNEIPNFPLHPVAKPLKDDTECVICEFIMQYLEKAMNDAKTKSEIEHVVHVICNHLPKSVSKECNQFVDQYADVVIDLLAKDISPKEICSMISLCDATVQEFKKSVAECALCQEIESHIYKKVGDTVDVEEIEEIISKVCKYVPPVYEHKCTMMMEIYEQSMINIMNKHEKAPKICSKLSLCSENDYLMLAEKHRERRDFNDDQARRCTWGEDYYCTSDEIAKACGAEALCKMKKLANNNGSETKVSNTQTSKETQ